MNSKQEAIDKLAFEHCYGQSQDHYDIGDGSVPCEECKEWAIRTYDCIAPLIRGEFPDEEVIRILASFMGTGLNESTLAIKRLWEGSLRPTVGDNILEQEPEEPIAWDRHTKMKSPQQDKPKGTCRTCGGSGKCKHDWAYGFAQRMECRKCGMHVDQRPKPYPDTGPCPVCDGTGEAPIDLTDTAKVVIPDRRSGEERRVWQRRKRDVGRREVDRSDSHIDRRTPLDRRCLSKVCALPSAPRPLLR